MALTGEITFISPEIESVRGITPEQAKAQTADQIHPPDSLRRSLAYFEQFSRDLLAGRSPSPFHEHLEYFRADGSTVWCEVMALPIADPNGTISELRGVSVERESPV